MIHNPCVSYSSRNPVSNGDKLIKTTIKQLLTYCSTINYPVKKGGLGSMYAFTNDIKLSSKSTDFKSDGIVFIDIDKCSAYSDEIIRNFDAIVQESPFIVAVSKSHSGNLHFFGFSEIVKNDYTKYEEIATLYLADLANTINKVCKIDFRIVDGALDTHNTRITQGLYLNAAPFCYNDNFTTKEFTDDEIKQLKQMYNFIDSKRKSQQWCDVEYRCKNRPNINIDTDKTSKIHYNYQQRYQIADTLAACGYNENEVFDVLKSICYDGKQQSDFDRQLLSIARASMLNKHPFEWAVDELRNKWNIKLNIELASFDKQWFENDVDIAFLPNYDLEIPLESDQYLSDIASIDDNPNRNIYIVAPCGSGKTEWMKDRATHQICDIIEPMKSTIEGKFNDECVERTIKCDIFETSGNTVFDKDNIEYIEWAIKPNHHIGWQSQVMIYDTFANSTVCKDLTFVDESHLLVEHDVFRESVFDTVQKLKHNGKKTILSTGSPMGEHLLLDSPFCVKITKPTMYKHKVVFHFTKDSNTTAKRLLMDAKERGVTALIPSNRNNAKIKKMLDGMGFNFDEYRLSKRGSDFMIEVNRNNKIGAIDAMLVTSYLGVGNEIKKSPKQIETIITNWNVEKFSAQSMCQFASRVRDSDITIHVVVKITPFLFNNDDCQVTQPNEELLKYDVLNGGMLSKELRKKHPYIDEHGDIDRELQTHKQLIRQLDEYWRQFPVVCTMFRRLGFMTEFVLCADEVTKRTVSTADTDRLSVQHFIFDMGIDEFVKKWVALSQKDCVLCGENRIEDDCMYISDINYAGKIVKHVCDLKAGGINTDNVHIILESCKKRNGLLNWSKLEHVCLYLTEEFDNDAENIKELIQKRMSNGKTDTKTIAYEYTRRKVEQSFQRINHKPTEQEINDAINDRIDIYDRFVRGLREAWSNNTMGITNPNINLFITKEFLAALTNDNREKEVTMTNGTITRNYASLAAFCDEQGFNPNSVRVSLSNRGSYKGWWVAS